MDRFAKSITVIYAVGVALIVAGQSYFAYVNATITDLGAKLSFGWFISK
jgi:hypothetical protein